MLPKPGLLKPRAEESWLEKQNIQSRDSGQCLKAVDQKCVKEFNLTASSFEVSMIIQKSRHGQKTQMFVFVGEKMFTCNLKKD